MLHELGELLESHIRLEERQLFPLAEALAPDECLDALSFPQPTAEPAVEGSPVVDLTAGAGSGPLRGAAPKGSTFQIVAGTGGLRYLTVHLRRPGLQIARRAR